MITVKMTRLLLLLLLLVAVNLSGCGGGGGADKPADAPTSPAKVTQVDEVAASGSGHFIVNEQLTPSFAVAVSSGRRVELPRSEKTLTSSPEDDQWVPSSDGNTWVRWNNSAFSPNTRIWLFDAGTLAEKSSVELDGQVRRPLLSPDGKYFLGKRKNADGDWILTVFDAKTGTIVKSGSRLDLDTTDPLIAASPAGWLPNGKYVYLVKNKVALGSPSSLNANSDEYLYVLDLPPNGPEDHPYLAGQSDVSVSPNGQRMAFTWAEKRKFDFDNHVWVFGIDATGLKRLTAVPDEASPLRFPFGVPSWSPDGEYVSFVLNMSATTTALVYPEQPFAGGMVTSTTGCGTSIAYTLPVTANKVAMSWPRVDAEHGIKVKSSSGAGGSWLTTCGTVFWGN